MPLINTNIKRAYARPVATYEVFLAGKVFRGPKSFQVLTKAIETYLKEQAAGRINRKNNRLILGKGFYRRKAFRRNPPWVRH